MYLLADSIFKLAAGLIIAAIVIAGLVFGRDILMPLACAIILAFMLSPLVGWATARGAPRSLAVGMTVAGVVLITTTGFLAFSTQLLTMTADLSKYQENLTAKVRSIAGSSASDNIIRRAARSIETIEHSVVKELDASASAPAPVVVAQPSDTTTTAALLHLRNGIGPLAQVGLTLLMTAFLLVQQHDLRDRVVRVLGTDNMTETTNALGDAGSRLSQFLLLQGVLNASFGMFVAIALFLIGVPNPVLWGIATMFLRFVPFVGSILAAVPPIMLAAAVDPGWGMALATIAIFAIGEPIMGHVIEPLGCGKGIGLTPLAVIASASFWAFIWGPIGLVLAAPLTMALVVLAQRTTRLEFLDVLMSDRPALEPALELYHRLLSDDPATAATQLEKAIETQSLTAVADEVILPALRHAARDHQLNRLSREDVAVVSSALSEAIGALDVPPAPSEPRQGGDDDIVVVPARGPVDALAARTIAAIIASTNVCRCAVLAETTGLLALSVAKERIGENRGVKLLISTIGGTHGSHLALLVRRARQECPTARVMVANWGAERTQGISGELAADVVQVSHLTDAAALLECRRTEPRPEPEHATA